MASVTVEEAQARLAELIEQLRPGEALTIMRGPKPVARLVRDQTPARVRRQPGNCKGMLTIVADDEEHLRDFAEYMG